MVDKDYVFRRISEAKPEPQVSDDHLNSAVAVHVDQHPGPVQMLRGDNHGGFTDKRPDGTTYPWRSHDEAKKFFPSRIRQALNLGRVFLIRWKQDTSVGCYVRAVPPMPSIPEAEITWCEARIGTRYLKGGTGGPAGGDCSWETSGAIAYATKDKIVLPHYSVSQYHDTRLNQVSMKDLQIGDMLVVEHPSDDVPPGHVALVHHFEQDGRYWVIDEEPGTLLNPPIPGGLHIRPGFPGYWCGPEFIIAVRRVPGA